MKNKIIIVILKKQQRKLNRIPEHAYTGSGSFMALDSRKISTEMTLKSIRAYVSLLGWVENRLLL